MLLLKLLFDNFISLLYSMTTAYFVG